MMDKNERRRVAFLLYIESEYSKAQIAGKLGLSPATIGSYARDDRKNGLDWDFEKEQYQKHGTRASGPLQSCMDLVLRQASQALKELEMAEDLPPQKRAKSVVEVMSCIDKATRASKAADPSLQVELIISQVLHVITEVLLKEHPTLAQAWLDATHQIEEGLQANKLQWD